MKNVCSCMLMDTKLYCNGSSNQPLRVFAYIISDKTLYCYEIPASKVCGINVKCSCIIEFIKRVWEKIRCEALSSILSVFPNEFNKFNNTGAQM